MYLTTAADKGSDLLYYALITFTILYFIMLIKSAWQASLDSSACR